MKKKILFFGALVLFSACTKDLTKLNVDPKHPQVVPSYTLFTTAENLMANNMTSVSENDNITRLIEQQWTEVQYLTESQYDIPGRSIADGVWDEFYTGPLTNFEKAKGFMKADVLDAGQLKNETAITDICEVYCFYYLVTTFGDIPYSEAFNANITFPKYDKAVTVYADLLKRLDADIANLDESSASFGSADMIYSGDVGSWKKFANTFKLKMGILLADSDPTTAGATITSALDPAKGGIFESNADNALYHFQSSPPYTNQQWVGLVQGGRRDYVATDTYMTLLGSQNSSTPGDPRTPYYFAENKLGKYVGAPNAVTPILYSNFSLPSGSELTIGNQTGQDPSIGSLANADFPGNLLDYSETQFYLAEAVVRGLYNTGSAATYYANGIRASVEYWTGSTNGADELIAAHPIGVGQAAQLKAIAGQQYLALYNRGYDAWTVNRRLDYPVLAPPPNAISAFPVRYTYPNKEQQINATNYKAAAASIGGDVVTTKLFFDTK